MVLSLSIAIFEPHHYTLFFSLSLHNSICIDQDKLGVGKQKLDSHLYHMKLSLEVGRIGLATQQPFSHSFEMIYPIITTQHQSMMSQVERKGKARKMGPSLCGNLCSSRRN
jgi:hypothetical protein